MNSEQQILCEILEESKDIQNDILWWNREWDPMKLNAYTAACFALQHHKNHKDRELLARILRCCCDSESGGVQYELFAACEAFSDNCYDDEFFIAELVNAAPEMLKNAPSTFSEIFGAAILPNEIRWTYFTKTFQSLDRNSQQVIADYLRYCIEYIPEDINYKIAYAECMKLSGIDNSDSRFFWKYLHNWGEIFRGYHYTPYLMEVYGSEFDKMDIQSEISRIKYVKVSNVVKIAPQMLIIATKIFGEYLDKWILPDDKNNWKCFTETFIALDRNSQQIIVDYLNYKVESNTENYRFQLAYDECLKLSHIEKGNSQFFKDKFQSDFSESESPK